jgi:hypothetical protein
MPKPTPFILRLYEVHSPYLLCRVFQGRGLLVPRQRHELGVRPFFVIGRFI